MKDSSVMKLCSTLPVLMLASHLSYAMPGMHGTEGSGATEPPAASKDMGAPINSSGSEIEITYSADGKTAIFVSTARAVSNHLVPLTILIYGWRIM